MRVLIADDHPLYRDGLRRVLEGGGIEVVAEARTGREAVALTRILAPDVVLLDLTMPDMGGVEATRDIKASFPQVKVVVLTASVDDSDLFRAINAGAQGYLQKDVEADDLLEILKRVAIGEPALTAAVVHKLFDEFGRPARRKHRDSVGLTDRELEVVELMLAGVTSNNALADRLVVAENTVRYHLHNIFRKLNVTDKTQAVAYAVRHGLIRPASPSESSGASS